MTLLAPPLDSPRPLLPTGLDRLPPPRIAEAAGITVYAVQSGLLPLVQLRLVAPAGARFDPAGKEGLAALLSQLKPLRHQDLEERGGEVTGGTEWDAGFVAVQALSEDLGPGIELLADWARGPVSLPSYGMAGLRQRLALQRDRRRENSRWLADDLFQQRVFAGTSYGRPFHGDAESLRGITAEDLATFHGDRYRELALIAVGRFAESELFDRVADCFSSLAVRPIRADLRSEPAQPHLRLGLVDRPDWAYVEIRLGCPCIAQDHPDLPRLELLNSLLGAGSASRLHTNLRFRRGWAYSVRSRIWAFAGSGAWGLALAVAPRHLGAAVREIFRELKELQELPPTAEEVDRARQRLRGWLARSFLSSQELIQLWQRQSIARLSPGYSSRFLADIEEVRADDLLALARRYLAPGKVGGVVVGPASKVRRQLHDFEIFEMNLQGGVDIPEERHQERR